MSARKASASSVLGCSHSGAGSLDESDRRLSHPELSVAERLVAEGHQVSSLAERRGGGRCADLHACGEDVEVKSWEALDRRGRPPDRRSVWNKMVSAHGQARLVVLNAQGSGLSAKEAGAGVAAYWAAHPGSPLRAVRVLGDGFDLSWARAQAVQRSAESGANRPLGDGSAARRPDARGRDAAPSGGLARELVL